MARKKIIAGNWKMNMTPSEAVKLVETLKPLVNNEEVDVVFCVPAIDIIPVVEAVSYTHLDIGSTCAKVAVLDEDENILHQSVQPTGWSSVDTAEIKMCIRDRQSRDR